jgi:general secretion pathway protein C
MADTWAPRILTLLAWALAAWSVTYWGLQFQGAAPSAAAPALPPAQALAAEPADVAKVFGPAIETKAPEPVAVAVVAVVDPSTRFSLSGVVASRAPGGVALLSVEGRPARPYRVGAIIDDAYTLKSVTSRSAVLVEKSSGTTFTVALAAPGSAIPGSGPAVQGAPGTPGTSPASGNAPAAGASPSIPTPRTGPIPAASMGRRSS